jgi:hypothetical protein
MQKSNPKRLKKHSQDDEPRMSVAARQSQALFGRFVVLGCLYKPICSSILCRNFGQSEYQKDVKSDMPCNQLRPNPCEDD